MTKENDFAVRDGLLKAALDVTKDLKPTARDRAVFDYLMGGAQALFITGQSENPVPAWLFVIGVRGGTRIAEIERMLAE